jgi:hypothetical protein
MKPCSIEVFVPDGDPEGLRIVSLKNQTVQATDTRSDILEITRPAVLVFSLKSSRRPCILIADPGPPSAIASSICSMYEDRLIITP